MTLQSIHTRPPLPNTDRPVKPPLTYRLKLMWQNPTAVLSVLLLLLFTYLIIAPIVTLLLEGLVVHRPDARIIRQPEGDYTLYYIWRVFVSPVSEQIFWRPLLNTATVALGAILLSLAIGVVLGWLLVRTDVWGRRWFATALVVPYMLPSWTFAIAWATIFKNRSAGGQPGWLETLGFEPPTWLAYGTLPIIIIFAIHFSPFVLLLVGNALKRFDGTLEESARMLGATKARIARTVILPLLRPALISAITLILAKVLGEFGVAYILGTPVNVTVLATSLFRNINSNQAGTAAVLAGAIFLIGIISLWVDTYFLREARRFVMIGGKGATAPGVQALGTRRWLATAFCVTVFVGSVALPLLVLALSTLMEIQGSFDPSNFTLKYWIGSDLQTRGFPNGVLLSREVWDAAWNTFWIVGLASGLAGVFGLLNGFVVVRSPSRFLSTALRQVTFLPYLVPGIAFATAYLSLFAVQRGPIPALYGSATLLVLIYFAEQMPFASRAGISSMMQLGTDPEEAAQMAGAGWFKRFLTIVMPIQKGALASGILMPFISGVKSLSLVIILAVPGLEVLTTLSIRLLDVGYLQAGNAVVLVVSAIAFFGTYLVQKLMKTDLSKGM